MMELDVFSTPLKPSLSRKAETGNLSETLCINQFRHWFSSHPFQSFCKTTLRYSFTFPVPLLVLEELENLQIILWAFTSAIAQLYKQIFLWLLHIKWESWNWECLKTLFVAILLQHLEAQWQSNPCFGRELSDLVSFSTCSLSLDTCGNQS